MILDLPRPDDWPMDLDLFVLTSNVEPLLSDAEEAADRLDKAPDNGGDSDA